MKIILTVTFFLGLETNMFFPADMEITLPQTHSVSTMQECRDLEKLFLGINWMEKDRYGTLIVKRIETKCVETKENAK